MGLSVAFRYIKSLLSMYITLLGKMFLHRLFFAINYLFFKSRIFKDIFMHNKSLLGSAMEKRGFSLVELMVVVVILTS